MKFCPQCGSQLDDNATFCFHCNTDLTHGDSNGNQANGQPQGNNQQPYQQPQNPYYNQPYQQVNPYDHTAEFDPDDISENKVIAMLPYLMGVMGIIIAAIMSRDSKYLSFHIKQALKLTVASTLCSIIALVLCITIIVPIAAVICLIIISVLRIIQFFSICSGKAKEVPIIRGLGFLK